MLQLSTPTNVASIVVHQAMAKALGRFNAAYTAAVQPGQSQTDAAEQGRQQQPGAAYQMPPELTYDELAVSKSHR